MKVGSFIFVLHSHVPYVRKSGKWPHGEEMLYEIIAETYIPLLNSLYALHQEKIPTQVSLGLTPVLLEQLADTYMQKEFIAYIKNRLKTAKEDKKELPSKIPGIEHAIDFYIAWFTKILYDYEHTYNRDIIGGFKYLQDKGGLDILTSAATHGYLPLLSRDSAIWGQLKTGISHYKKYFDRSPTGIWLPECGYRPLSINERVGIEHFLDELGLQYFFTDSHVIEQAVNGFVDTTQEEMPNSFSLFQKPFVKRARARKKAENSPRIPTFQPYTVGDSNVHVFGRDKLTGMQVWSAQWGYPGDFVYKEFHKKAPTSGIQYWKITDRMPGMKHKQVYNPKVAFHRAEEHAAHFTESVTHHLQDYYAQTGEEGVVVSSYDTELFGHWWFEGVHWLEHVIRQMYKQKNIDVVSARHFIENSQGASAIQLSESSWGDGGHHSTWYNPETAYMWPEIHGAEDRFEKLAKAHPSPTKQIKDLLNQTARELLLLQSSDWPFLITTVQAKDYAEKRFAEHRERFNALCDMIEKNKIDAKKLHEITDTDNLFKDINYKDFM